MEDKGKGKLIARSTQYYRKHYAKNKKPSFKPRRVPRPAAVKDPLLLLAESIKLREQQQVSDAEFKELPLNKLNVSTNEEIQQISRPDDDDDDWMTTNEADEEHEMRLDSEVLECPGMFSTGDGSTDEEVGPKEPVARPKRRRLRKRIIRERLDSDDALTTSSESCASRSSSIVDAPSPVPSPEPILLQSKEACAADSQYEVVSEENVTGKEGPPRKASGTPLCPCTDITAEEVMFMTLILGLRHGLTWVAQVDILKMISTIFKSASIPTSKHMYKERLNVKDEKDIMYHVFCSDCLAYLGEKPKNTKSKYCSTCEKNIKVTSSSNCFVSLSVEAQLQKYLQDDNFVENIMNYRFNRPSTPNVYSDIYDGKVYKQFSANGGILSSPYNFSFTFFTDGVAFGKSSNKTIWPIYLTVNELPYHLRKKYFLLAGVYAGPKDPNQLYFLKPFVDMMNNLSSNGVKWFHNGSMVKSIVITICCVVDSVARYQVLNFTNFFGHYGCTFCYVKTQYIQKTGSRYPVTNEPAAARNYEDYKTDILKVSAMKPTFDRAYRGVKGTCNLINLQYFSIFDNFVVDYMHNLLLGCVKRHTTLILESSRKKMWIDVHENNVGIKTLKAVIDERIATVQSNTAVIRELRGISDMSLWRANEWQQWLLFYFVTCLTGLLKPKFILHFALLSKAAFILLQKSMTHADLQMAHKLLMSYTFYFQKCFGEKNMVYNIHLLSHVVRGVYNFGPIWGHSSFMYETQNRYLLQLCRSPNSVSLQVARKFSTFQSLPNLSESLGCSDRVADFSEGILNYKRLINCQRANDNQCILMGQPQVEALPAHISKSLGTSSQNCLLYQRCIYKNNRYTTNKYCKGIANNDSYLFLGSGECVNIEKIVKIPDSQRVFLLVQIVALDRKPLYQNDKVKYDCISKVVGFKGYKFVRLDDVGEPCLLISVSGVQYVARLPYGCTVE